MNSIPKTLIVLALALASTIPIHAQTTVLLDGEVGSGGGFGFKEPHLAGGISAELTRGRFEFDPAFSASPDVKTFAQAGHSIALSGRGAMRLARRVAVEGGISFSSYWSEQPAAYSCPVGWHGTNGPNGETCMVTKWTPLHKSGWHPVAGVDIRDGWYGSPGRVRIEYHFPIGCVWATANNPCPLTSSRTQGVSVSQEFALWPKLRFGIRAGWWRYGDQVNPYARAVGQSRHNTGSVDATIRYVLFSAPRKSP